ncbi:hypothetical protein R1flu_021078 [Riccia fluitans]|uniref:Uncharacterized protein n=1 Tax=Riccia fluitans TaxID=41844 RepID=A0ABD1ZNB9_9MARC
MSLTFVYPIFAGGHALAMDIWAAKFTIREVHLQHVNRSVLTLDTSTPNKPIRVRCEEGLTNSDKRETESLKRGEIVQLLSTAVNTLLLPENLNRLRERLHNSGKTLRGRAEAPFPRFGENPSTTLEENSAGGNSGQVCSLLGLGRLTMQFPGEENPETNAQASFEESSPSLQSLQKVSVSDSVEESEHAETGVVEIQRVSSAGETGVSSEDTALSTMRRLKILNVHSYVQNALRQSFLRSHLRSRKIEE